MDSSQSRWEFLKQFNVSKYGKAKDEGKADKPIIPLCDFLNSKPNYFTSSSCSGRIILIDIPGKSKKRAEFLLKWHSVVNVEKALKEVLSVKGKKVWFRFDPFILHISCRTMKDAEKVLKIKWDSGIRRGGIHSISEGRLAVELDGSESIAVPVMEKGKFLVDKAFFRYLLKLANVKMRENRRRFKIFEKNVYERIA